MVRMALDEKIVEHLRENSGKEFVASEIAQAIFNKYPEECERKKSRSRSIQTNEQLIGTLAREISSRRRGFEKKYPQIKTIEDRPQRYYWVEKAEKSGKAKKSQAETLMPKKTKPNGNGNGKSHHPDLPLQQPEPLPGREAALYPLLQKYLRDKLGIYSMCIDAMKSHNQRGPEGNKWLLPKIIGIENLTSNRKNNGGEPIPETAVTKKAKLWSLDERMAEYFNWRTARKRSKLWALDVQPVLDSANVREVFLRAVSNASWANFGYLATVSIQNEKLQRELELLAARQGIGVIKIDADDPMNSRILIPARERLDIDLAACDFLTTNTDFLSFIKEAHAGKFNSKAWEF